MSEQQRTDQRRTEARSSRSLERPSVSASNRLSLVSPSSKGATIALVAGLTVFAAAALAIAWPLLWQTLRAIYALRGAAINADEINKLWLPLAGIVGGAVTLALVIWRTFLSHRQTHIANETLYTQLLSKAVEQLGATREEKRTLRGSDPRYRSKLETLIETVPNVETRLGAIYALEKIARDYQGLHWQIMEILCAFVRQQARSQPSSAEVRAIYAKGVRHTRADRDLLSDIRLRSSLAVEVQAALTVIGRRPPERSAWEADKRRLRQTAFRLDLRGARLAGANLDQLWLEGALLDDACLEGATLRGTQLKDASLLRADLRGVVGDAKLKYARLSFADLQGARLTGADLSKATLIEADLERASLDRASLRKAALYKARLDQASCNETDFSKAELGSASFRQADLTGASLRSAKLKDTDVSDTLLVRADLTGAVGLSAEQLATAWGTARTRLPKGLEPPDNAQWCAAGETAEADRHLENAHQHAWAESRFAAAP